MHSKGNATGEIGIDIACGIRSAYRNWEIAV
jgi:hypothetical protein